ncbi:MAG: septum site-determining protein MinC [Negativicutes bacterium]|nr:septum site-determining protein MinC [Negativicutes bacterium]
MREDIVFKGVRGEIQLILNETADFSIIMEKLKAKLVTAAEFFCQGTTIKLPATLSAEQRDQITGVLTEHGLSCQSTASPGQPVKDEIPVVERDRYETRALVLNRTLRSGQKVVYDGSVVVVGDVNAGAQIIAGEDIIILGSCRGVAHAGAAGNLDATITATKLVATQLRIGGVIARAPDDLGEPTCMEVARIKEGMVIIEPANR